MGMKRILLLILVIVFAACKPKSNVITTKHPGYKKSRPSVTVSPKPNTKTAPSTTTTKPLSGSSTTSYGNSKADKIIKKALSFKGTKYKYGGITKSGMDCSGLMYASYKSQDITLPRTSFEQSKKGTKISVSKVQRGDLVFFKTTNKNRISHVGLVIDNKRGEVRFIHSSSSRGVMISSLKEGYWSNTFAEARRLL
ncbi:MAG: C40 family peptidase [Flavobacteriaceae bacterium]|nr:C40 family peptidase [Flavobacteriaceae bacterium]